MQIAEALRLLRTRKNLTQTAASKRPGAPDFRTLSHWETRRKLPSLGLLYRYLTSLDLDFRDLQEALHQVEGTAPKRLQDGLEMLKLRVEELERCLGLEPLDSSKIDAKRASGSDDDGHCGFDGRTGVVFGDR